MPTTTYRVLRTCLILLMAGSLPLLSEDASAEVETDSDTEVTTEPQATPEATPEAVTPEETSATLAHYQPLFENSPFLTPEFRERMARTRSAGAREFVFHGYTKIDGEWIFCIFHRKNSIAHWIKLNDTVEGYTLTAFNRNAQTVELSQGSLKFNLILDQPR